MNKNIVLKISKVCKTHIFFILLVFFLILTFCPRGHSQTTQTFSYTGSTQSFVVPCGVSSIHVKAQGAGGSHGGADSYPGAGGGGGAYVESDIAVTAGQVLTIVVGGGATGNGQDNATCVGGGAGGWGNGVIAGGRGGNAGCSPYSGGGGGGGGGSGVFNGGTALLVAGGGGGGSGGGQYSSGGAGGGGGNNGSPSGGSSCTSPGIAGASSNGNGGQGEDKGSDDGAGGGGGGGGYLGGTGGGAPSACDCGGCGGAGGSSYSSGTNTVITNAHGSPGANGSLIISFSGGAPDAEFTATTVCSGTATQFTNNSTTSSGSITSVSWNFGDGSPANTSQNPAYIYAAAGNYNVALTVTNSLSCTTVITQAVKVNFSSTSGFTSTDVCFGDSIHFTNTSTVDPGGSTSAYLWMFGDGTTSILTNPSHYYASGTYTVRLTSLCSDTATHIVHTFDAPTSQFTSADACLFDSVVITNSSINPTMGTIASWSWDFGDGSTDNTTLLNLKHRYATAGMYQISLITHSSNLGCADTLKKTVTIFPMPVASFSLADVCLHLPMNFYDSSTVSSGTITAWSWSFGDGSPLLTTQNPSHTYLSDGTKNISLIVTTNNGCKDTATKTGTVHPLPAAHYSAPNVCDGSSVQFNNLSTLTGPDVIQTNGWTLGDGTNASTLNTSHVYASAGSYNTELLVVSSFGCRDSIPKTIVVNPNPNVHFTANDTMGCANLCLSFQNTSTIATGHNAGSVWDCGDGSPISTSQDLLHCYGNTALFAPMLYTPSLTVTSDSGCVTTLTKTNFITVFPNPHAAFTALPETTTIVNPLITIKDLSTGATSWNWNFGDMDSASTSNPLSHTYADTGTYQITLITATQYGCGDTAHQTVIIEPDFVLYIPNAFTPNGDGFNDTFTAKGIFVKQFAMSIFDRWGNLIFSTNDIDKPWDGHANHGADMAQKDVYVYQIDLTDFKNKTHTYRGIVTLVR